MRGKGLILLVSGILALYIIMQYLGFGMISIRMFMNEDITVKNGIAVKANTVVAVHGPYVYIAWYNHASKDIMLNVSHDGGNTFKKVTIAKMDNAIVNGVIARGSYVNVVWTSEVDGQYDIFLAHSHDGVSFNVMNISNNLGDSTFPVIDASGNMVYIAWIDSTYGNTEVLLRVSHDGGNTFSDAINISSSKGESENASIAAEGSSVYIVWQDNLHGRFGVFIKASHDNGNTFSDATMLSDPSIDSGFASVLAEGKDVYITWLGKGSEDNRYRIYVRVSNDAAKTFNTAINISNSAFSAPLIASDGALVILTWVDVRGIAFARLVNDGVGHIIYVSVDEDLEGYDDKIKYMALDVDGYNIGMLVLLRQDSSNDEYSMIYINSKDGGLTFNNATLVYGSIDDVSMHMKGSSIYITWGEKVCHDKECSSVSIKYSYTKSDDLSTFKRPTNLIIFPLILHKQ